MYFRRGEWRPVHTEIKAPPTGKLANLPHAYIFTHAKTQVIHLHEAITARLGNNWPTSRGQTTYLQDLNCLPNLQLETILHSPIKVIDG